MNKQQAETTTKRNKHNANNGNLQFPISFEYDVQSNCKQTKYDKPRKNNNKKRDSKQSNEIKSFSLH